MPAFLHAFPNSVQILELILLKSLCSKEPLCHEQCKSLKALCLSSYVHNLSLLVSLPSIFLTFPFQLFYPYSVVLMKAELWLFQSCFTFTSYSSSIYLQHSPFIDNVIHSHPIFHRSLHPVLLVIFPFPLITTANIPFISAIILNTHTFPYSLHSFITTIEYCTPCFVS